MKTGAQFKLKRRNSTSKKLQMAQKLSTLQLAGDAKLKVEPLTTPTEILKVREMKGEEEVSVERFYAKKFSPRFFEGLLKDCWIFEGFLKFFEVL